MEVNMFVYKITNIINGKCYIGQTRKSVEARFREHVNEANRGARFYLQSAIRKYGPENFRVETIATANNIDELNQLEEYYIRKFNTVETGYNLSYGGDSNTMDCKVTKEHHDKVMRSEDVRSRISQTLKRKIRESGRCEEYTNNLLKGLEAYRKTPKYQEDKAKFHLSSEHFRALNDAKNKAVYCINESGSIVAEFNRVKDAAYWWYNQGYKVKDPYDLSNRIKQSYKEDKFIRGLKWIYRV